MPQVPGWQHARSDAAVTPKGERRRYALVSAAADLLCEGGFDAVRHRAVARRAGLPLASTTYYFSSLDDLIEKAVEYAGTVRPSNCGPGLRRCPGGGGASSRPPTSW